MHSNFFTCNFKCPRKSSKTTAERLTFFKLLVFRKPSLNVSLECSWSKHIFLLPKTWHEDSVEVQNLRLKYSGNLDGIIYATRELHCFNENLFQVLPNWFLDQKFSTEILSNLNFIHLRCQKFGISLLSKFKLVSLLIVSEIWLIQIVKKRLLRISQFSLITSVKSNWFNSGKYFFTN